MDRSSATAVHGSVNTSFGAGKTLLLALFCVSASACGNVGLPGSGQAGDAVVQSTVHDPQARAFYEARQWKPAWDRKSEKALLAIIAAAPANGLKPDLFLKQPLSRDPGEREAALT